MGLNCKSQSILSINKSSKVLSTSMKKRGETTTIVTCQVPSHGSEDNSVAYYEGPPFKFKGTKTVIQIHANIRNFRTVLWEFVKIAHFLQKFVKVTFLNKTA